MVVTIVMADYKDGFMTRFEFREQVKVENLFEIWGPDQQPTRRTNR